MTKPIDFIIPWVDGGDPEWLAEKNKYSEKKMTEEDAWDIGFRHW